MIVRWLTAVGLVLLTFLIGGCTPSDRDICGGEGGEQCLGFFAGMLIRADFKSKVDLVDDDSILILRLFQDDEDRLAGEISFDGKIEIWFIEIWDKGHEEYAVDGLKIRRETVVRGRFNIPEYFLDAQFKGTFEEDNFDELKLEVKQLGEVPMLRIEDEDVKLLRGEHGR